MAWSRDSSQAARTGGCFSENATVVTPEGRKRITEVRPGDSILSVNSEGEQVFSEVIMFLDRNATETREFYHLTTSGGTSLALTPSHLIYKIDRITGDELGRSGGLMPEQLLNTAQITFAKFVEAGDWLLVSGQDGKLKMEKLVHMESTMSTGVYAPLTKEGNVVIDGVLSSCYAVINDQSLAHWAFAPVRLLVNLYEGTLHAWKQLSRLLTFRLPLVPAPHLVPTPSAFQVIEPVEVSRNSLESLDQSEQQAPASVSASSQIRSSSSSSNNNHISSNQLRNHSNSSSTSSYQQGVHWYASWLYATSRHFIPAHLLYE